MPAGEIPAPGSSVGSDLSQPCKNVACRNRRGFTGPEERQTFGDFSFPCRLGTRFLTRLNAFKNPARNSETLVRRQRQGVVNDRIERGDHGIKLSPSPRVSSHKNLANLLSNGVGLRRRQEPAVERRKSHRRKLAFLRRTFGVT